MSGPAPRSDSRWLARHTQRIGPKAIGSAEHWTDAWADAGALLYSLLPQTFHADVFVRAVACSEHGHGAAVATPEGARERGGRIRRGAWPRSAGIDFDKYDAIPVQITGANVDSIKPISRFSEARRHAKDPGAGCQQPTKLAIPREQPGEPRGPQASKPGDFGKCVASRQSRKLAVYVLAIWSCFCLTACLPACLIYRSALRRNYTCGIVCLRSHGVLDQ